MFIFIWLVATGAIFLGCPVPLVAIGVGVSMSLASWLVTGNATFLRFVLALLMVVAVHYCADFIGARGYPQVAWMFSLWTAAVLGGLTALVVTVMTAIGIEDVVSASSDSDRLERGGDPTVRQVRSRLYLIAGKRVENGGGTPNA